MRRALVLVLVGLCSAARAQDGEGELPEPVEPVEPVEPAAAATPGFVGAAGSADAPRLVDAHGRVLALAGDTWRDETRGSLAPTLAEVHASLWAVGSEAPAFRFEAGTWRTVPVRREGAAHLSACAGLGLSVGRRVYLREARSWRELPMLPRGVKIRRLCVTDKDVSVLAEDGRWLVRGAGWSPVKLPPGTTLDWLGGGTRAVAASSDGKLFVLTGGKPTRLAVDSRPLAVSPADRWLLLRAGRLELAVLRGNKLVRLADGPVDVGGDRVLALLDGAGSSLLLLRDGSAHRFAAAAWTPVPFRAEPPAAPAPPPENPPALVGSAATPRE